MFRIRWTGLRVVQSVVVADPRIKRLEVRYSPETPKTTIKGVLERKTEGVLCMGNSKTMIFFFQITDVSLDRATSRIARPKFSTYQSYPRKSSSLMNLCGKTINCSGVGFEPLSQNMKKKNTRWWVSWYPHGRVFPSGRLGIQSWKYYGRTNRLRFNAPNAYLCTRILYYFNPRCLRISSEKWKVGGCIV